MISRDDRPGPDGRTLFVTFLIVGLLSLGALIYVLVNQPTF